MQSASIAVSDAEFNERAKRLRDHVPATGVGGAVPFDTHYILNYSDFAFVPTERPMVASVFVNRLRLGMRLQTDPTVIYGMGERYAGNIHKRDLTDDTPWNTYTRDGLPPTPISMPGIGSIRAALQPASSDYLYFVARGDGTHEFTRSLEEHNRAVAKWQLHR